jgi:type VI secretion system protein ImpC
MAEAKKTDKAVETVSKGSLLDEIVQATKVKPNDEGYSVTKKGVEALLAQLFKTQQSGKISHSVINDMIVELDKKISAQLDAILHAKEFQK